MKEGVPIFPLGLVLYPDEELPLHIFEPRYREMVAFCLEKDRPFGIVLFHEGEMAKVGCLARVTQIIKAYDDGRKDILVTGGDRMRVLDIQEEKAYYTADVEIVQDVDEPFDPNLKERVIAQHIRLLELADRMPAPTTYQGKKRLSFFIAHNAGLTSEQKQDVLEMKSEAERLGFLASHMEKFIPMVEEVESIRMKVLSNGHFKDFPIDGDASGQIDDESTGLE